MRYVLKQIGGWCRVAAGWHDWQGARFVRFGDNMRFVAVTDGDKVEAEMKFGYAVNTHGVGDLVKVINEISDAETDNLVAEYEERYAVVETLHKGGAHYSSIQAAAKIELGLHAFLKDGNYKGFTDTFEDLHGMLQLPGNCRPALNGHGIWVRRGRRLENCRFGAGHESDGERFNRRKFFYGRLHLPFRSKKSAGFRFAHAGDLRIYCRRKT